MESEKTIERVITRQATNIVKEDEEISAALHSVILKAVRKADETLEFGAPQDAVAVMKLLLGRAAKDANMDDGGGTQEAYALFERVFESQRHVEAVGHTGDELKELTP